jgi:hypothetical protein
MGLYPCRRQHCTSPWRRMWTPLLAGLWLGNPWDRHVMGGRAGSRSAPISRCAALRSWWPRHRATLSLLPTLVPTPPLGYPGDVPDLLLLRFFIFSVSDRVCVSIAHCPLAHASLTLTSTTPATSSPTVLLGAASSVPGDARMPYLHLFVDTSISADSSSPLLIGGGGVLPSTSLSSSSPHTLLVWPSDRTQPHPPKTSIVCHEFLNQARGLQQCCLFGQQRRRSSSTLAVASTSLSSPCARSASCSTPASYVDTLVDLHCTCMLRRHPLSLVCITFIIDFFADKYRCHAKLESSSLFFMCVVALAAATLGSSMRHLAYVFFFFQHKLVASVVISSSTTSSTPL